mgnify:CR=1 FL=1
MARPLPLPGISMEVVDDEANAVGNGHGGLLTITEPWPSMLRGIWGDPERFKETYWARFPGRYFAGDGAKLDEDGDLWLLGRVDDVMNVSGHRLSTTEIESALVSLMLKKRKKLKISHLTLLTDMKKNFMTKKKYLKKKI